MVIKNVIKKIASSTGLLYVAAMVIVLLLADQRLANIRRLDNLARGDAFWNDYRSGQTLSRHELLMAARYHKLLVGAFPKITGAYGVIGYCYTRAEYYALAAQYFDKGTKACPFCSWFAYNAAVLRYLDKKDDAALKSLKKVVDLSPEEVLSGVVLSPLNKMAPDQRRALYATAQNFARDIRTNSWKLMIRSLERQGRHQEAIEAMRRALGDVLVQDHGYFLQMMLPHESDGKKPQEDVVSVNDVVLHPWAQLIDVGKESYY